jgi:hypothetical protein
MYHPVYIIPGSSVLQFFNLIILLSRSLLPTVVSTANCHTLVFKTVEKIIHPSKCVLVFLTFLALLNHKLGFLTVEIIHSG